jgi:FlgD Ig-like domain
VTRFLPIAIVLALLAGTAAAFAVAERLKLERVPIGGTSVVKQFSPVCECDERTAAIRFRLRRRDVLTVSIVDRNERVVRTLAAGEEMAPGRHDFEWDGRDDAGRPLPDGRYRPRVRLADFGRTFDLRNAIHLDSTPPRVRVTNVSTRLLTPDGNDVHDRLVVRYRVNEPAHVLLYVNGKRRFRSRFQRRADKATWYGRVDGRDVPAGTYRLAVVARDLAGNLSDAMSAGVVRVRYVQLARRLIRTRARARFGVRVLTDTRAVRWRLGSRSGVGRRRLVLRAPGRPGRYRLYVVVGRHAASARLVVRPRGRGQ